MYCFNPSEEQIKSLHHGYKFIFSKNQIFRSPLQFWDTNKFVDLEEENTSHIH